jgi:hypothetical protein
VRLRDQPQLQHGSSQLSATTIWFYATYGSCRLRTAAAASLLRQACCWQVDGYDEEAVRCIGWLCLCLVDIICMAMAPDGQCLHVLFELCLVHCFACRDNGTDNWVSPSYKGPRCLPSSVICICTCERSRTPPWGVCKPWLGAGAAAISTLLCPADYLPCAFKLPSFSLLLLHLDHLEAALPCTQPAARHLLPLVSCGLCHAPM